MISTALFIMLMSGARAQQDGTWLSGSGSGNWGDDQKWENQDIADGSGSTASFQLPASDGSYTVTLDSDRILGEIRLLGTGWSGSRGYVLDGTSKLHFQAEEGTPQITLSADTSNSFIGALAIQASVSGSQGLVIAGPGRRNYLQWNPASMELTGGIRLEGAGLIVSSASALGSNVITMGGTGVNFLGFDTEGLTYANNIVLDSSNSGFMNMVAGGSTANPPATHTIAGNISQTGGTRSLNFITGTNTVQGTRFILEGNNSFTGTLNINSSVVDGVPMNSGSIVVQAAHNNAFGTGSSVIQIHNTNSGIELSNEITISNKTLRLNGEGYRGLGSMNNISGDNVWAGSVILRYNASRADNPRIGVEAGSLTVSGVISDGVASSGLDKVGPGTLVLTANNNYASGTRILEGTVVADHNSALGTGDVTLAGGTLFIAASRSISNRVLFDSGGGRISGEGTVNSQVNLTHINQMISPGSSPGNLTFNGEQNWESFTYEWELNDWSGDGGSYDTVTVAGELVLNSEGIYLLKIHSLTQDGNAGSVYNFDPQEDRSWNILSTTGIVGFDEANWLLDLAGFVNAPGSTSQWSIQQSGGDLILQYAAIPEPAWGILLVAVMIFGLRIVRRKK